MRAAILVALLLLPALSGCLEGPRTDAEIAAEEGLVAPPWEVGDWWLYTFVTPEFGEDSARLVVADEDPVEEQWMLGISSEREAMRHAVVNHNPFLGRVKRSVARRKCTCPAWSSPDPASTMRRRSTPAGSVHVKSRRNPTPPSIV